jgi:hypothetical protein
MVSKGFVDLMIVEAAGPRVNTCALKYHPLAVEVNKWILVDS